MPREAQARRESSRRQALSDRGRRGQLSPWVGLKGLGVLSTDYTDYTDSGLRTMDYGLWTMDYGLETRGLGFGILRFVCDLVLGISLSRRAPGRGFIIMNRVTWFTGLFLVI
jgi:hypothetical protein